MTVTCFPLHLPPRVLTEVGRIKIAWIVIIQAHLIVAKHCSSSSKVQSRTNGPNKPFLYSSTQCRSHLSSPTKSGWSSSECTCSWCWLSLSFSQLIFGTTSVREQHSRNIQIDTLTSHTFRQAISARTSTLFHHQKRTISSSFTIS